MEAKLILSCLLLGIDIAFTSEDVVIYINCKKA